MDIVERYLSTIEFWLPKKNSVDILAEIREDIESQIEDQEASLGRALHVAEIEALLKQRGRPMLVANRYRPQRYLIGPVWFPTYAFVLKMVGLCYVLPWLVVYVVVNRFQHPGGNWGDTLLAAWATIWTVAFTAAAVVTLIFAILERTQVQSKLCEEWSPRKLPPLHNPFAIPRSSSVAESVAGVVFALWWIGYAHDTTVVRLPGFEIELSHKWLYFFWGYLALGVFNIGLAIANLLQPHWTNARATGRLLSDLAGGVLFCWLLTADVLQRVVVGNLDSLRDTRRMDAIHLWIGRCFPIAVIVTVVVVAVDVARLLRLARWKRSIPQVSSGITV